MNTPLILGVDIAKRSFTFHAQGIHRPTQAPQLPNTPEGFLALASSLPSKRPVMLGLEATSTYHLALAEWAHARGWSVFVLNPFHVYAHRRSESRTHKNDALDAVAIAEFMRQKQGRLRPYQPTPEAWRALRELSKRRTQLVSQRTGEVNRLESLPQESEAARQSVARSLAFLDEELMRVEQQMRALEREHEELGEQLGRCVQIPGVGLGIARVVAGELGELRAYGSGKQLTARVGLVPLERESGTSVRGRAKIGRAGGVAVRAVLYMGAMRAMRLEAWQPWIEARQASGKTGKCLLMAIMDKMLRLMFGLVKHGQDFDPEIAFSA